MERIDQTTGSSAQPAAMSRGLRAVGAAWASIGPMRPGPAAGAVPPSHVLWALPWVGLALGGLWSGLFAATWRIFGEQAQLRLVPALVILVADCLLSGRLLMAGVRTAEAVACRDRRQADLSRSGICAAGALTAAVLVVAMYGLLLAVPVGVEWWPNDWRWYLHRLYPRPVFRPLVLMPLWACWSMVLAAGVGPAAAGAGEGADPAGRIAGRATPRQIFVGLLPAAVLSAIYCSRDGNLVIGLAVSLVVFVAAYATAMATALAWRGQNATTILTTGLVGRTVFLLSWLFIGRIVHGW